MNKYNGLIISLIAGMSTIIGFFSIYINGDKGKIISRTLSFAGGVMIMLSVIDLMPSSIQSLKENNNYFMAIFYSLIFFIVGFIVSHFIQSFVHENDGLSKAGIISMIGIILHNIPEGIATYVLSSINLKFGIILAIAIIMHNIPEGVGISIPIYYGTGSKKKAFVYTLISGISEPVGAVISMLFLYKHINISLMGEIYSVIAGIMVYIGYFELIKLSNQYGENVKLFTLLGALFILIVEIILKL